MHKCFDCLIRVMTLWIAADAISKTKYSRDIDAYIFTFVIAAMHVSIALLFSLPFPPSFAAFHEAPHVCSVNLALIFPAL